LLGTLSTRRRRIAHTLASGETTGGAAKKFAVTAGRISQVRRELDESWSRYQTQVAAG
jgi:hypothetical protein